MYPPNPGADHQKYSGVSPPPPPPPHPASSEFGSSHVSTGIPVSSAGRYYTDGGRPPMPQVLPKVPWSSGLCDCGSDCQNCCITCWCPCITFGQIAEIVDKGSSSCGMHGALYALLMCVTGCTCLYSCFYRSKLRQQYMLREKPCNDCLVHCFCEGCALCQEYRELKHRGYDMSIGWHGNVERRNRGVTMNPVASAPPKQPGGMTR